MQRHKFLGEAAEAARVAVTLSMPARAHWGLIYEITNTSARRILFPNKLSR